MAFIVQGRITYLQKRVTESDIHELTFITINADFFILMAIVEAILE